MIERYIQTLHRYRFAIIALSLCLFVAASAGLFHLNISTDFRIYLGDNNSDVKAIDLLNEQFTKNETLYIALDAGGEELFTRETLRTIESLTEKLWQTPYSSRVDSITNYQHSYSETEEQSDYDASPNASAETDQTASNSYIVIEHLFEDVNALSNEEIAKRRSIALSEPSLTNFLISKDAKTTAIQITFQLSDDLTIRMSQTPEAVAFVRQRVQEINQASENPLNAYLAGSIMMNQVMGEAALNDILILIPICYAIIIALMTFLLRSLTGVALTMMIVTMTNGLVLGLAGWSGHILAPIIGFVPCAILVIAVADAIHLLNSYYQALSNNRSPREAVKQSLQANVTPIAITTLTTVIGFLCLNFNESPPYRDLGNMVALGAFFAFLLTITTLPALLLTLKAPTTQSEPRFSKWMPQLGHHIASRAHYYLPISVALVICLAVPIKENVLDDNWNNYFDESIDFRVASEYINDNISGLHRIDYMFSMKNGESISNPETLQFLDQFKKQLMEYEALSYVATISDTFKRLNKNMNSDQEAFYTLPESKELSAQYLLLYEMSLPYGLDIRNQISFYKNSTRVTVILNKMTSEEILAIGQSIDSWLENHTPSHLKSVTNTGLDTAFAHIARSNTKSMIMGTFIAFLLISMILALVTRSLSFGIISLIPNMLPAICAFGVWGLTVGEIGLATSAVVSMAIGIIVDDTVHFLSKYRYARTALHYSPEASIIYTFQTVGVAMMMTTCIIVCGFLIMGLSPFQPTSQMGLLLSITIFIALILDLMLLPSLLIMINKIKVNLNIKVKAMDQERGKGEDKNKASTKESTPLNTHDLDNSAIDRA